MKAHILLKKQGLKWIDEIKDFEDIVHLSNYMRSMERTGWIDMGTEIIKQDTTTPNNNKP